MSAAEVAPVPGQDPYDDPEVERRLDRLVDSGVFSYDMARAAVAGAWQAADVAEAGPREPASAPVGTRRPRNGTRRGVGAGQSFESDRVDYVPAYQQPSSEGAEERQKTLRNGVAKAWAALDQASANRLGISVEEATELRLRRMARDQRRR